MLQWEKEKSGKKKKGKKKKEKKEEGGTLTIYLYKTV